MQTAERVSQTDMSDNFVFRRSLLAYVKAAELVGGKVLEIGSGSGYGIEIISPETEKFVTIDKFETEVVKDIISKTKDDIEFIQMTVPPLAGIPDNSFDFVITFQVIEHIENDDFFVKEIYRVLKNNGSLIVTTPNKKMSLTRNPWHVREYTVQELDNLLLKYFQTNNKLGVFGDEKSTDYYNKNRESVKKITRFDIFNLQYKLPRRVLQIPYDILNRLNRRKLLKQNSTLVSDITIENFNINPANDACLDLFYVATKKV